MSREQRIDPKGGAPFIVTAFVALACIVVVRAASAETPEAAFAAENEAAMTRMMAGMDVKPSGDVDRDFAAMMIPHHQGAIEMAVAELRYGRNERLRRIAQEIVVEQMQEIGAMNLALGRPVSPSEPVPTQASDPVRPRHNAAPASEDAPGAQRLHQGDHQ
jgi:hypothetical protein